MKKLHIATTEGQAEYDEPQARALWDQGKFPSSAKYWINGMVDWQPLSDYFGTPMADGNPYAPPTAITHPEASDRGGYTYSKSPRALTRFLIFMLWLSLASEVVSVLSEMAQYSLLSRVYTAAEGESNDARQQLLATVYLVILIATAIPFLRWIHRANFNCRGFGANDLTHTPGWSVGWFFVPFMNLVRPYQAMKEIWQASHNPRDWRTQPGSPILRWWWGLWLASGLIGQISFRTSMHAETVDDLKTNTLIAIGANVVSIALCLVAIAMDRRIFKSQESLVNGD